MNFPSDDRRPPDIRPATATIVYDTLMVVVWALLLLLVARRSGTSLTRDLF